MKIPLYNQEGEKVREKELSPRVFAVPMNASVIRQVVVASMAYARSAIAHAKTRAEVRGGGRKPWKQKGTGRARHGSIRSPLWKGGGVTFGPSRDRNFVLKINKKMKKKALAMVLSDRVKDNKLVILDKLELGEIKTKQMASVLAKLPSRGESLLIVVDKNVSHVVRAARNIPKVKISGSSSVNIVDALSVNYIIITEGGVDAVTNMIAKSSESV